MWLTTYTVRLASPALRTWRGSRPATPGRILEFSYTVLPQNPPYVGKPSRKNSTVARSAEATASPPMFQKEDQRVLVVRVDQCLRVPVAVKGCTASHLDSMLTDLIVTFKPNITKATKQGRPAEPPPRVSLRPPEVAD